eukprot:CAMPEP_0184342436 /NCGR_PEP_ID=MMETSP1089-20130417/11056_1 /TAXON_ID=38269 ORGANISM="Gloeochaete wittrockiana, Strain SAG46.84" /NCGR_SAMPLE_ID=MMETSP1089 /ASSEMBLY_ACC=CAM_ASM_000445 /LENGTH=112 /DNA_ID=CAMNT_0026671311 /DNA_START=117 /DNA_END=455 /DNA_ORIENTATION=-
MRAISVILSEHVPDCDEKPLNSLACRSVPYAKPRLEIKRSSDSPFQPILLGNPGLDWTDHHATRCIPGNFQSLDKKDLSLASASDSKRKDLLSWPSLEDIEAELVEFQLACK